MARHLPWLALGIIGAFFLPRFPASFYTLIYLTPIFFALAAFLYAPLRPVFFLTLGLAYAVFRIDTALARQIPPDAYLKKVPLIIKVVSNEEITPRYHQFTGEVLGPEKKYSPIRFRDYRGRPWPRGAVFKVDANLRPMIGRDNLTGFSAEARALSQGLGGRGTIGKKRRELKGAPYSALDRVKITWGGVEEHFRAKVARVGAQHEAGAGLVAALTLGATSALSDAAWTDFRLLGLSHLVSISGLHIGMIALLVSLLLLTLLRVCIRWGYGRYLPGAPMVWIAGLSFLAACFYGALAGWSIPTQRTVIMLGVVSYAVLRRRYQTPAAIWWLALAAVLLFNPFGVLSVGFWLSFLLVASLLFLTPYEGKTKTGTYLVNLARVEYVTTVAAFVPLAVFFFTVPLYSFFANLIFVPWFTLVMTPMALLGVLLPMDGVLMAAIWLAECTLQAAHFMAAGAGMFSLPRLPFLWLFLAALSSVVLLLPRGIALKPWAFLLLGAVLFYVPPRPQAGEMNVTLIDVGQGLALLVMAEKHQLLFDTGNLGTGQDVAAVLYRRGVKHLDLLVLSHPDADHDANWGELARAFGVQKIAAGEPKAYASFKGRVDICAAGGRWDWDNVHFEFLTPEQGSGKNGTKSATNQQSCVLRVVANGKALLVTGDLDRGGEKMLTRYYGDKLFSNILVLGHHGSNTSSSAAFLDAVSPDLALISSGYLNPYGHPHKGVLARLKERAIPYWRTDLQGGAEVILGKKIKIQGEATYHPFWQKKPFFREIPLE